MSLKTDLRGAVEGLSMALTTHERGYTTTVGLAQSVRAFLAAYAEIPDGREEQPQGDWIPEPASREKGSAKLSQADGQVQVLMIDGPLHGRVVQMTPCAAFVHREILPGAGPVDRAYTIEKWLHQVGPKTYKAIFIGILRGGEFDGLDRGNGRLRLSAAHGTLLSDHARLHGKLQTAV